MAKRVSVDLYGVDIHVEPGHVGRRGELKADGEPLGPGLFAGAEELPGDGWRLAVVCDNEVAEALAEILREMQAGRADDRRVTFWPTGERRRLRDRVKVHLPWPSLKPATNPS